MTCAAKLPSRIAVGLVYLRGAFYYHAWAEVWIEDEGWVSVDVTHRQLAGDWHCRLAIGRDYLSAAPVRGVRTGGGEESLRVQVSVVSDQ